MQELAGAPLVCVVAIRMEEGDRQRLDVLLGEGRRDSGKLLLDQGSEDPSGGVQPLRDLPSPRTRDERREGGLPPVQAPARAVAELEDVLEACGGEQAGPSPRAREKRIRGHGRAVGDLGDVGRGNARGREGRGDTPCDVLGGRRDLVEGENAVLPPAGDHVREGPADVNPDVKTLVAHIHPRERAGSYAVW